MLPDVCEHVFAMCAAPVDKPPINPRITCNAGILAVVSVIPKRALPAVRFEIRQTKHLASNIASKERNVVDLGALRPAQTEHVKPPSSLDVLDLASVDLVEHREHVHSRRAETKASGYVDTDGQDAPRSTIDLLDLEHHRTLPCLELRISFQQGERSRDTIDMTYRND